MHAHVCELLHAHNEKFYRGINYFRGGPNISEIFGPGGPNIMGVQIFRYRPNDKLKKDLHVYLLLYQSLYDLTNPNGCNLISFHFLPMGLISVFDITNSLGHRLILALVLTSYLKCCIIILILGGSSRIIDSHR